MQRIVSASKTPSGVASYTEAEHHNSDPNIYEPPLLTDRYPAEEKLDHSFTRVPSINDVDDPSKASKMSASVEDSAVFRPKADDSCAQSYCENLNEKDACENLILDSETIYNVECCEHGEHIECSAEKRTTEEPTIETENGNILVEATPPLKPISSQTVTRRNVHKGRRKDRSSSSSARMARRSSTKIKSRDVITIDTCKDCDSHYSVKVGKRGTETSGVESSTSSDEEHNVKPKKSSSNFKEPVRAAGTARKSKEHLCEGSLLQIHRCETA